MHLFIPDSNLIVFSCQPCRILFENGSIRHSTLSQVDDPYIGKKNLILKAKLSNEFNDLLDIGSLGPLGVVALVDGLGVSGVKELLL